MYESAHMRRLMLTHLKDKLLSPAVLSQFLTWVVTGAVKWYQEGLGDKPKLMRDAEQVYIGENDALGQFINTHCLVNRSEQVDTTAFREAYQTATDTKLTAAVMKSLSPSQHAARSSSYAARSSQTGL